MTTRAYSLGCLLAALEHAGAAPNARQLYVQASVRPAALGPALARAAASGQGADTIAAITARLAPDAFDGELTDEEQSAFGLGYYQQRAALRTSARPSPRPVGDVSFEFRLDAELKAWILEQGGSAFVRRLLQATRERDN